MRYKFLFFDADNTLFDFSAGEKNAFFTATKEIGIEASEADYLLYSAANDSLWKQFEKGAIAKADILKRRYAIFKEKTGYDVDPDALNACYMKHLARQAILFPFAETLLHTLREKGYRLFLLTNGATVIQRSRLAISPVTPYFEGVFISEEMGHAKPSPLFYEAVAGSIEGFSKEETLMIGDSESSDILGANNFGIDACYFDPHNKPLTYAHARYRVHSLEELTTIL